MDSVFLAHIPYSFFLNTVMEKIILIWLEVSNQVLDRQNELSYLSCYVQLTINTVNVNVDII